MEIPGGDEMEDDRIELTGTDASIETSLFEYGMAWHESTVDDKLHFIVRVADEPMLFGWADFGKDIDLKEEFNFVDWEDILSFTGMDEEEWFSQDLPFKIFDLISFYGTINVIGETYNPMSLEDIGKSYQVDVEESDS